MVGGGQYGANFASVSDSAAPGVSRDFPGSATGPANYANGRIDLLSAMPTLQIPAYQRTSDAPVQGGACTDAFRKTALTGTLTNNPVSDLYFSDTNINALQEGVRYRIYQETNGKHIIGRQSDTELKVVMRSLYLQYSRNLPEDVVGQVRDLNRRVLEWVVPEVLSNLKQHLTYIRDASTMPMPLEHGQLMTAKGTRTLEMKSFF